jgi:4-amino-4-deoxy-L-arabinose transferase-like glycosyltransferase
VADGEVSASRASIRRIGFPKAQLNRTHEENYTGGSSDGKRRISGAVLCREQDAPRLEEPVGAGASVANRRLIAAATSLWLIAAVAAACRIGYAWHESREIPPEALASVPFQQETGNIAYALASGKGFSSPMRSDTGPTAWLTPVYPTAIALVFRIFGIFTLRAFYAAAALNILFSVATCVPIYFAARRIGGLAAASIAAWLWALFPNAIVIPFQWIWDTSLTAFLSAAILWATLEISESRRKRDWCAYGLLWGFTLMTNPALGSLLPILLGWSAWRHSTDGRTNGIATRRGRIAQPALAAAIAILCCIPWTARNYAAFHRFIPLRSNFPFELWLGNNEVFDDRSPNINARITRYGEARRYAQLGETEFMQEKWNLATDFIRTHKPLELRLVWWRFEMFWLGSFHPLQDFENADSAWIRVIFAANFLTAIGSAIGIAILWRRRNPFTFPAAAYVIVFPLIYYAAHASLRYRHPIDPIVLTLTAIAIDAVVRKNRTPERNTSTVAP